MTALSAWTVSYGFNALWQVALIFAVAWLIAHAARRVGVVAEHRIWVGALLAAVVLPAVSWRALLPSRSAAHHATGFVRVVIGPVTAKRGSLLLLTQPMVNAVALAYVIFVVACLGRLAWGLWKTSQLQRRATPCPEHLTGLHILESAEIAGPVVVGLLRPRLLLPPHFAGQVAPEDLHVALAHEQAHMLRHDFARNLVYEALLAVIRWHPAAWAIQVRLVESREMVCDSIAAEQSIGSAARLNYARSLLRLAARMPVGRQREFHAIGMFDANSLERRINRMTNTTSALTGWRRAAVLAACSVTALATVVSASALSLRVQPRVNALARQNEVRVSGAVMAGAVASREMPVYPAEAKANHDTLDGAVILHVIVDQEGVPVQIAVKQSLRRDYDISALEAVRQWRWKPYLLNGQPTAVDTTVTINFSYGGK